MGPGSLLTALLLAAGSSGGCGRNRNKKKVRWYIDGCNLLGHKGVGPKDPTAVARSLHPIVAGGGRDGAGSVESVVLVFDGAAAASSSSGAPPTPGDAVAAPGDGSASVLRTITLSKGTSADDFIYEEISQLLRDNGAQAATPSGLGAVNVVTADRDLRRRVLAVKPRIVRNVVNPKTFWKRYLPRLAGLKLSKEDEERTPDDD